MSTCTRFTGGESCSTSERFANSPCSALRRRCHTAIHLGDQTGAFARLTELSSTNTWLVTGTPFPHGSNAVHPLLLLSLNRFAADKSLYAMHQLLGIKLKMHISNNPFCQPGANSGAIPVDPVFEKLKRRCFVVLLASRLS